jgi:hypothetical protein
MGSSEPLDTPSPTPSSKDTDTQEFETMVIDGPKKPTDTPE